MYSPTTTMAAATHIDETDTAWSGFGRFLLSMPMRFATQAISGFSPTSSVRHEWLYRPPAAMSPALVFSALENDPDLHNVELAIIEEGLKWSKQHGALSINVSPAALGRQGVGQRLERLVQEHQPTNHIWWEITETWPIGNVVRVSESLGALRRAGGKIAIDDIQDSERLKSWVSLFGAPDVVKVDKSVLHHSPAGLATLVDQAHDYGCDVVVEGVETQEQLTSAKSTRATFWQGFLAGQPAIASL